MPETTDLTVLLDQLDAARAKATPGPWEVEHVEDELKVTAGTARTTWTEHDGFRLGTPPSSWRTTDLIYEHELDEWDVEDGSDDGQRLADAACIVAEHNAIPRLTAALRAVLALHRPEPSPYGGTVCVTCMNAIEEQALWPCPTFEVTASASAPAEEEGA